MGEGDGLSESLLVSARGRRLLVNTPSAELQEGVMASIMARIRSFLQSPQGRRVTDQGRRMASDPRMRQKLRGLLSRRRR